MDKPKIKAMFKHYDVTKAMDLLWYFSLSREEAVEISKNSISNTDRNIFSEVHLSALLDDPKGKENPYKFLMNTSQYDIVPYLKPSEAKQDLQKLANFFLYWNTPKTALKLANQMFKLDEVWGRSIKHDIYFWRHDFQGATDWYKSNADWRGPTHIKQLQIYLMQHKDLQARELIQHISDQKWQRVAKAVWLFYQKDWKTLAAISPQSDEEKQWQLLGLAKTNIVTAGQQLEPLVSDNENREPFIRVMIRYYAATENNDKLDFWSLKLANQHDFLLERYNMLTKTALEENNLTWNQALIDEIRKLDPHYVNLPGILQSRQNKIKANQ